AQWFGGAFEPRHHRCPRYPRYPQTLSLSSLTPNKEHPPCLSSSPSPPARSKNSGRRSRLFRSWLRRLRSKISKKEPDRVLFQLTRRVLTPTRSTHGKR